MKQRHEHEILNQQSCENDNELFGFCVVASFVQSYFCLKLSVFSRLPFQICVSNLTSTNTRTDNHIGSCVSRDAIVRERVKRIRAYKLIACTIAVHCFAGIHWFRFCASHAHSYAYVLNSCFKFI